MCRNCMMGTMKDHYSKGQKVSDRMRSDKGGCFIHRTNGFINIFRYTLPQKIKGILDHHIITTGQRSYRV